MIKNNIKRKDLIYPELCYKIVGTLFNVYNEIGTGHKENYYQKAIAIALQEQKIEFKEQVYCPLKFNGKLVGKYFLDFLIDRKIVLEIKKGNLFLKRNLDQVYEYLKVNNLKLGIIANFTRNGVKFKRIVNIK